MLGERLRARISLKVGSPSGNMRGVCPSGNMRRTPSPSNLHSNLLTTKIALFFILSQNLQTSPLPSEELETLTHPFISSLKFWRKEIRIPLKPQIPTSLNLGSRLHERGGRDTRTQQAQLQQHARCCHLAAELRQRRGKRGNPGRRRPDLGGGRFLVSWGRI